MNETTDLGINHSCQKVWASMDLWKKSLLDLSKRNRLLFIDEKASKSYFWIGSPDFKKLFELLFAKEKELEITDQNDDEDNEVEVEYDERSVKKKNDKNGEIEILKPSKDLQKLLARLSRRAKDWKEEYGLHTLFLGIGIVNWKESPDSEIEFKAPVLLFPIDLKRRSHSDPYFIKYVEEEIVVNPALAFKLKADQNIEVPNPPDEWTEEAVGQYLLSLTALVEPLGWEVANDVLGGLFTYEKFGMYTDLEDHLEDACKHQLIRILAKDPLSINNIPYDFHQALDDVVDPKEVFPILDADSSQMEVLLRARMGQNLIVQGPPGTGKSQTIANLIAQSLRDGKKILFVSEKIAALEVVSRRLNQAGLSFACLEVHSHKSDKVKIVRELNHTLTDLNSFSLGPGADYEFRRYCQLRDHLNNYVRELHMPRGPLGYSAFKVHSLLSQLLNHENLDFELPINSAIDLTNEQLDLFRGMIFDFSASGNILRSLDSHPWSGVDFEIDKYQDLILINEPLSLVNSINKNVSDLILRIRQFSSEIGISFPNSLTEVSKIIETVMSPPNELVLLPGLLKSDLDSLLAKCETLEEYSEHFKKLASATESLLETFNEDLLNLDVEGLYSKFQNNYRSIFRFLSASYKNEIKSLIQFMKEPRKLGYKDAIVNLEYAVQVRAEKRWIDKNEDDMIRSLGKMYKGVSTNFDGLVATTEWVARLAKISKNQSLSIALQQYLESKESFRNRVYNVALGVSKLTEEILGDFDNANKYFHFSNINGKHYTDAGLDDIEVWSHSKANQEDLFDWVRFQRFAKKTKINGFEGYLNTVLKHNISVEKIEGVFYRRLWTKWLDEAYREAPVLSEFNAKNQQDLIKNFQDLDRNLKNTTIKIIQNNIAKNQPSARVVNQGSQMSILLREGQKKRRVKPLRKLFSEIPHLIQELKPCLMMSPLSVAKYLGKSPFEFDLVIFDEASQILPADAIGSILRGKQLIVAGDEKQLPPTKFFQAEVEAEDEEDEWSERLESILNECNANRPYFVDTMLKWHYRSKYEELIDFSNKNFYNGKLVTFPGPNAQNGPKAVNFHYVEGAVYDRGKSRTNRKEAIEVVDMIEKHFSEGTKGTLGVITLNSQQEDAIIDEWEQRKNKNPILYQLEEADNDEPFFIKALERVQGDERDFIILSLGYGPDVNHNITLNFGPINKDGGERRLNVAVTRAREQMTLVSSIRPNQLDLSRLTTKKPGVIFLQKYLEYADRNGKSPEEAVGIGDPESEFEYAVMEALMMNGLTVDSQVGCSGFRIDLGVRDPDNASRYILGIECDGATYHSHRTARERDRLRQEVLERLGWKIYRIWSTDWIKNQTKTIQEVVDLVAKLRSNGGNPEISNQYDNVGSDTDNSGSAIKKTDKKPVSSNDDKGQENQPITYSIDENYIRFRTSIHISQIPRMKIENEIVNIVKKEFGIPREQLIKAVSKSLGYGRAGKDIARRIGEIIGSLIKNKTLEIYNDQIIMARRGK